MAGSAVLAATAGLAANAANAQLNTKARETRNGICRIEHSIEISFAGHGVTLMKIERYKMIAEYIAIKTGISVTENVVRKWAGRRIDPLPVEHFSGRITADKGDLDAWIARQRGVARRSAAGARK
jgi:hypothetical protein